MTRVRRPRLRQVQEWMAHVMRHPATADVAVRSRAARAYFPLPTVLAGAIVKPSDRMSVTDRLQVYNGGYLARLQEVLRSDYGALEYLLGAQRFNRLCAAFVERYPSAHPNLNQLGRRLPGFVARQRDLPHPGFATELATLERLLSDAFDAPAFTPLATERLQAIAPKDWERARLVCNPSLRLAAFRYPVNAYYIAFREEKAPRVPRRQRTHVAVFRRDYRVFRSSLEPRAHAVLAALQQGVTLGRALARARGDEGIGLWFQTWASDGLFTDVKLERRPSR